MVSVTAKDNADRDSPWLRTYFITRLSMLDSDRRSYWETWRQEARMFSPKRGRFFATANDSTRGRRKDQAILDNTARIARRTFASGMMAGATSPARPWFKLRFLDPASNELDGAKAWLDEVVRRMHDVLRRSNLYNCLHTLYDELGVFSTAVLLIDEDEETVVRGYVMTAGEYWLASSRRLKVDTLYRSFWWTVRQIVAEFGRDNVSGAVRAAYDTGRLDLEYEIVHAIEPNPNAAPADARIPKNSAFPWDGRLSSQLPWRSVWFERGVVGEHMLLKVSGYHEFPAICPRWAITSTDTYGSDGPGETALGDSQQLQVEQRRKMEVIDKLSKPPMKGPPYLENRPASALPGGMTIVAEGMNGKFEPAFMVDPVGVNAIREDVVEVQQRIKDAWYVPLFMAMLEGDRMQPDTAREVDEKHEEKMMMLGPMLERFHEEGLDPLIKRIFNIMARMGLIPPPPEGINMATMEIEFVSILAQAQKAGDLSTIERFWQFLGQLAQLGRPDALDRGDVDGTVSAYEDRLGVPASIVVAKDVADGIRQQRAKQQQQAEQLQALNLAATAGKTASEIDVGGGRNAVSAAMGTA